MQPALPPTSTGRSNATMKAVSGATRPVGERRRRDDPGAGGTPRVEGGLSGSASATPAASRAEARIVDRVVRRGRPRSRGLTRSVRPPSSQASVTASRGLTLMAAATLASSIGVGKFERDGAIERIARLDVRAEPLGRDRAGRRRRQGGRRPRERAERGDERSAVRAPTQGRRGSRRRAGEGPAGRPPASTGTARIAAAIFRNAAPRSVAAPCARLVPASTPPRSIRTIPPAGARRQHVPNAPRARPAASSAAPGQGLLRSSRRPWT